MYLVISFVGLPATVANGTNRIAILLQNIVGVSSFSKQKLIDRKASIRLVIPSIIGALIGANLAIDLDEELMKLSISALLIIMFFIVLLKPDKWVKGQIGLISKKTSPLQYLVFFLIGLYGGFIQAGVGFFLLSGLVLSVGYDLLRANALKVFIVLLYSPFALFVYIYNDHVHYGMALISSVGNIIGGIIASRLAISWGTKFIHYFLLAVIILFTAKTFGLFNFLW